MKKQKLILTIIFSLNIQTIHSQTDSSKYIQDTTDLTKSVPEEILFEDSHIEEEDSDAPEFLQNLKRNPYDLNKVTLGQLETIPFIGYLISKRIIDYRNEIKVFKSKRALLKIDGITEELYEKIKVYLIVRQSARDILIDETGSRISNSQPGNFKARIRLRLFQDLQTREGFINGKFLGTKPKFYNQYNAIYLRENFSIELNLTAEKDPGEISYTDFISGFAEVKSNSFIDNIIAGDYSLNFAQGIAMWSSASFSKGADAVITLKKKGKAIDGYGSVNEVQFFRGAAVGLRFDNCYLRIFYSDNFHDASVDNSSNEAGSFYFDGYHRTTSELQRSNSLKEKLFGGRITFENGGIRLGGTYWTSRFSAPVIRYEEKELYKFSGDKARILSADYDLLYRNMNFYGEWAVSKNNSIAGISSLQIAFLKTASLLFTYRNYPEDFAPLHSTGFGEKGGDTYNERGFYSGIKIRPLRGLEINGYFDQYSFPYRTFYSPVPASGNDFLMSAEWKAAKGLLIIVKYKKEIEDAPVTFIDESQRQLKKIIKRNQLNLRTGFIYQLNAQLRLRSRFEYVSVDYSGISELSKGSLFFSDIRIIPVNGFVFDARIIFFDTQNYDSRIYEFENDIIGLMSGIPLYNKGRRWYMLLKYKPFSKFEINLKYSETYFDGAKSIGAGNDKITGDVINRFSFGIEAGL